ncbi:hypothetical protein Y032_0225g2765 [Ancylostoma ceylanicum]|uniref:Serpentine receptor class gamma n=1 Tax=Ancylostoma ceylanicum TaxID=53326 RepID=A0A016SI39_9BILA|nr:hypothetical protein Y032_0225g2765 [Ancylostoma ceylanicum]
MATERVERNLLICAAASSLPFCVEFIREIAVVSSSFDGISDIYISMTELWFYEMGIVTSLPMWLQVIVNRSLRKCVIEEFVKQWERLKSTSSIVHP